MRTFALVMVTGLASCARDAHAPGVKILATASATPTSCIAPLAATVLLDSATQKNPMNSYSSNFASPTRASRVAVGARTLSPMKRIAPLGRAPLVILVSPTGDHIAVDHGGAFQMWSEANGLGPLEEKSRSSGIVMLANTYLASGSERKFDRGYGRLTLETGLSGSSGAQWAIAVDESWAGVVTLTSPVRAPMHVPLDDGSTARAWNTTSSQLMISASRIFGPSSAPGYMWNERFDAPGCGAIGSAHTVVAALRDGRFSVIDGDSTVLPVPPAQFATGKRLIETKLSFSPYDMSIVPSGYALLEVGAAIPDPKPYGELERTLVLQARRVELFTTPPPRWKTMVHHLDLQGKETWHAEVPFEILQPPIDGSEGRIYVMGMGAAAFQDGKLLFATPSALPMFGTAFQDGSLAVAVGPELRIVGRDGQILQRFNTAEREQITTPPAIGSDGSVWVGSATALYVAR